MDLWRIYPYPKTTESVENDNTSNLKMKKEKLPLPSLKVAMAREEKKKNNNQVAILLIAPLQLVAHASSTSGLRDEGPGYSQHKSKNTSKLRHSSLQRSLFLHPERTCFVLFFFSINQHSWYCKNCEF